KPPKQFDETVARERIPENPCYPLQMETPGVSRFLWTQVRDMGGLIGKIEKKDALAIFYRTGDPLELLSTYANGNGEDRGTCDPAKSGKSRTGGTVTKCSADEDEETRVMQGWLPPARSDGDRATQLSSGDSAGARQKTIKTATGAMEGQGAACQGAGTSEEDASGSGVHEGDCEEPADIMSESSRKRAKKMSSDSTKTRRQSADEGQDSPLSPALISAVATTTNGKTAKAQAQANVATEMELEEVAPAAAPAVIDLPQAPAYSEQPSRETERSNPPMAQGQQQEKEQEELSNQSANQSALAEREPTLSSSPFP
ncbi:unnamed protein product, partial [Sphacelaria rigidula]